MNIEGNQKAPLSVNNIVRQVQNAENGPKRLYYDWVMEHPDKTADGFQALVTKLSGRFSDEYKDIPSELREFAIFRGIATNPIEDVLPNIPESEREQFLKLRNSKMQNDEELLQKAKSDPVFRKTYTFLDSVKGKYAEFVDDNRLDPSKGSDPHPKNIRVLAAVSQSEPAAAANSKKGEKADWVTKKFSDALRTENSIDKAMDVASKDAVVKGYPDGQPPIIQKPVSTKRENVKAWKKSDNDDPNVKRIVIFNVTEDGSRNFENNAAEIRKNFYTPSEENKSNPFEQRFRADRIITVTPPTEEEAKKGITQADKIRSAFEQSKQFMEDQKDLARKKAISEGKDPEAAVKVLRFEGMANWFGHGTTVENKSPKIDDPRYLQEGSAEFKFITNPLEQKGIEESEIKKMEQNVKDYDYFTQYFCSCHSGAMIN